MEKKSIIQPQYFIICFITFFYPKTDRARSSSSEISIRARVSVCHTTASSFVV